MVKHMLTTLNNEVAGESEDLRYMSHTEILCDFASRGLQEWGMGVGEAVFFVGITYKVVLKTRRGH